MLKMEHTHRHSVWGSRHLDQVEVCVDVTIRSEDGGLEGI